MFEEVDIRIVGDQSQAHDVRFLYRNCLWAAAFKPKDHHQTCDEICRKDRRDNAQPKRDRKAAYRAGTQHEQNDGDDKGGDVGIKNGAQGAFIAQADRARRPFCGLELFADAFKDQNVCVNRHTDRQHDPCDTWQGQRGPDQAQQAKNHADVDDQRDIGKEAHSWPT